MSTDSQLLPDPALLPDDPAVLKQLVMQLLEELHKANERLQRQEHHMHLLLKRLYGSTSEKFDPRQGVLFDPLPAVEESAPGVSLPVSPPVSKKRDRHGRGRIPEKIQREERVYDLTEAEMTAMGGAENLVELPPERSEQLDWRPSTLFVIVHIRKKYARKVPLLESGPSLAEQNVAVARKPPEAIPGALAAPGLMAQVIVSKGADHLPPTTAIAAVPASGRDFQTARTSHLTADNGRLVASDGRIPTALIRLGGPRGAGFSRLAHRRHPGEDPGCLAEAEIYRPVLALCGRSAPSARGLRLHHHAPTGRTGRVFEKLSWIPAG